MSLLFLELAIGAGRSRGGLGCTGRAKPKGFCLLADINSKIKATEAIEMAALARASGVPKADILVEPQSRSYRPKYEFFQGAP